MLQLANVDRKIVSKRSLPKRPVLRRSYSRAMNLETIRNAADPCGFLWNGHASEIRKDRKAGKTSLKNWSTARVLCKKNAVKRSAWHGSPWLNVRWNHVGNILICSKCQIRKQSCYPPVGRCLVKTNTSSQPNTKDPIVFLRWASKHLAKYDKSAIAASYHSVKLASKTARKLLSTRMIEMS